MANGMAQMGFGADPTRAYDWRQRLTETVTKGKEEETPPEGNADSVKALARIEVTGDDMARFDDVSFRNQVVAKLKELGFLYVTLDLQGYRTGSMNETLTRKDEGSGMRDEKFDAKHT